MPRHRLQRTIARSLLVGVPMALLAAGAYAEDTMVDFVVERADTLIGLSTRLLVSPTAWREVARINRLPNPNHISTGLRLRMPTRLQAVPVQTTTAACLRRSKQTRAQTSPANGSQARCGCCAVRSQCLPQRCCAPSRSR